MSETTIKIHEETKFELDTFREYKNESYNDVVKKVMFIAKNVKNKNILTIAYDKSERYDTSLDKALSPNQEISGFIYFPKINGWTKEKALKVVLEEIYGNN